MFLVDSEGYVFPYTATAPDQPDESAAFGGFLTKAGLAVLIQREPGQFAVKLWNRLCDEALRRGDTKASPILTSKFRNRATAVERIWNKLAELYPDAILPGDMPKKKQRGGYARKNKAAASVSVSNRHGKTARGQAGRKKPMAAQKAAKGTAQTGGRKSAWASELTEALRKRFNPGQEFGLEDVYKLIPSFQRRHKENNHVAARLRTTLAQDLRGNGVVKAARGKQRGRYVMA